MLQKLKSDYLSWIVLIGAFFLLLDVFFFNRGLNFLPYCCDRNGLFRKKADAEKNGEISLLGGAIFPSSECNKYA